jgi:hypothetical protein
MTIDDELIVAKDYYQRKRLPIVIIQSADRQTDAKSGAPV